MTNNVILSRHVQYFVFLCGLFLLASCASTLNVGNSDFACPGMPSGVRCQSVTEVYKATRDGNKVNDSAVKILGSNVVNTTPQPTLTVSDGPAKTQNITGSLPQGTKTTPIRVSVSSPHGTANAQEDVLAYPVLQPAEVLRVWIAPYTAKTGDLVWPGVRFTEITPRRWAFGEKAAQSARTLTPLQIDSPSVAGSTSGRVSGTSGSSNTSGTNNNKNTNRLDPLGLLTGKKGGEEDE